MHELSVIKALLKAVNDNLAEHHNRQVKTITIEVGKMTCVEPQRLQFCFDMVKEEAGFNNTLLTISSVVAKAQCQACGNIFELERPGQPCGCGSYQYWLEGGDELNLTEIEFV